MPAQNTVKSYPHFLQVTDPHLPPQLPKFRSRPRAYKSLRGNEIVLLLEFDDRGLGAIAENTIRSTGEKSFADEDGLEELHVLSPASER